MISFMCPSCKAAYQVPDNAAGQKSNCRSCGQRLQVPAALNKTVLGELLPSVHPQGSSPLGSAREHSETGQTSAHRVSDPPASTAAHPPSALPATLFLCPGCKGSLVLSREEQLQLLPCPHCQARLTVKVLPGDRSVLVLPDQEPKPGPEKVLTSAAQEPEPNLSVVAPSAEVSSARQKTLLVAGAIVAAALVLLALLGEAVNRGHGDLVCLATLPCAGLCAIVGLAVLIYKSSNACPYCRKGQAVVFVSSRIMGQKKCYGLVDRSSQNTSFGHISGSNRSLSTFGMSSWKERAPVIRTTYEKRFKCRFCSAKWVEEVDREEEDFDRP